MKCPACGAETSVMETREVNPWTIRRRRQCARGHRSSTYEVQQTVWNTAKHRNVDSSRTAERRSLLDTRNRAILADLARGVQAKVIALEQGVSESTVSLVKRDAERSAAGLDPIWRRRRA